MHSHHFDAGGILHTHQRFNHPFIKHIIIHFIWYFRYEIFLRDAPLETLNYVIAMAGAAVHCVLLEQQMDSPSVDPFTGLAHYNKFIEIINALAALEGEDKAALEAFKVDICEVGPSQRHTQPDNEAEEW
ncbi:hypothetical protein BDR03DRAFT_979013 [Suillus americanus]|nr:hypothetical protein BDR03DRAFT_979013 [Suillus americanus]